MNVSNLHVSCYEINHAQRYAFILCILTRCDGANFKQTNFWIQKKKIKVFLCCLVAVVVFLFVYDFPQENSFNWLLYLFFLSKAKQNRTFYFSIDIHIKMFILYFCPVYYCDCFFLLLFVVVVIIMYIFI